MFTVWECYPDSCCDHCRTDLCDTPACVHTRALLSSYFLWDVPGGVTVSSYFFLTSAPVSRGGLAWLSRWKSWLLACLCTPWVASEHLAGPHHLSRPWGSSHKVRPVFGAWVALQVDRVSCGRLLRRADEQCWVQPVRHSPPGGPECPAPRSFGVCPPRFLLSGVGSPPASPVQNDQEGPGLNRVSQPLLAVQLSA